MTVLREKERFGFLTIDLGFKLSYVITVLWGVWSFQHGLRGMLSASTEEEIVAKFGPHFRERSYVVNGVASFFAGGPIVNQSYAMSYMLFEGCIDFCDVFVGCGVILTVPAFFLIFWRQFFSSEEHRLSTSSLKGRLKVWLAPALFGCCFYLMGFMTDAGNMILTLPPEAHVYGKRKLGLRYLLWVIPTTHVVFSFLWYWRLRSEKEDEKDPLPFFNRCSEVCSVTSFGWHIFWVLFLIGFMAFYLSFMVIDLRSLIVQMPS